MAIYPTANTTIVGLTEDISMECFFLLGGKDLCRCACVSRLWKRVFEDDKFWTRLLTAEWGKFGDTEHYIVPIHPKEIWKRLATTSYDKLSFPIKNNNCFEIAPNYLLKGASNGELQAIDFVTGESELLSEHRGADITCCAYDGSKLIYGTRSGDIVFTNLDTEDMETTFCKLPVLVSNLHLKASWLFSGHADGGVLLWDLATKKPFQAFVSEGDDGEYDTTVCAIIASDTHLCFGLENGKIEIWEIANTKCLHRFQGHEGGIDSLQIVESHLYSSSYDGVKVWDINTGKCVREFEGEGNSCFLVCGPKIFLGCYNAVKILDLKTGELTNTLLSRKLDDTSIMRRIHIAGLGILRAIEDDFMTSYSIMDYEDPTLESHASSTSRL